MDRSIQSGSRARLLVIEDADDAREMLKFLLEIKGYVVDTAPDEYEGIALARARSPAVAVIDIGLPGLDGWSVATTLRREFDDRIRLIACTSWGRAEDRARSAAAGFDAHLVCPGYGNSLGESDKMLLFFLRMFQELPLHGLARESHRPERVELVAKDTDNLGSDGVV